MESKISYSYINSYSADLAQQLTNQYFGTKDQITGQEVLQFTELQQINLFVLKAVFHRWQGELEAMDSPYFDYGHEAVLKARKQFMNVVSKHILIGGSHYQPLLQEAIANTMLIVFSPYDFYQKQISAMGTVSAQSLKDHFRFVRINKHLFDELLQQIESIGQPTYTNEEVLQVLERTFERTDKDPEDIDTYVDQLSRLKGLQIERVYVERTYGAPPAQQEEAAEPSLNDQLGEQQKPTLNERFQQQNSPSIADLHQQKKISSIKRNITINQRFMFVNELFKGNMDEFNNAIEALDNYDEYQNALEAINEKYAVEFSWEMDSDEVVEFLEVVAKRYSE